MSEGLDAARKRSDFSAPHRFLLVLAWAQVPSLAAVGLALGEPVYEVAFASLTMLAFALAGMAASSRRLAAMCVAIGLLVAAFVVVDYAGGVPYSHVYFFAMLAAIAFYEDRLVLALGVVAVTIYHLIAAVERTADPLAWAGIHSGAVALFALLLAAGWRLSSRAPTGSGASGARFQMSFEAAPIGMAVLKPSGEILEVNVTLADILGYDRDSLVGVNVTRLIHSDDQPELGEAWEEMGNGLEHAATEWMRCLTASGRPMWGRVSIALVPHTPDEPAMVVLQIEDATHAYEEQRRLRRLLRGKDEFVATVGDEIRRPLGLLIDLTDRGHVDSGDTLPRIGSHAREIATIVDDLVVSARAGVGPVAVVAHHLDAEVLCRDVISDLPGAEGVTLEVTATELWADPSLSRQIVNNLVTNALRYGGPSVVVRTTSSGPDTVIEVIDDGPAIQTTTREMLFDADLRSGTPATRPASVGLSLTVSRHLAREMDGDLEYRRTREGENLFELRLPSEQISEAPRPRPEDMGIPA